MYRNSETTHSKQLTRFTPGGILELFTISLPLILSLISGGLMLIVDRLFLAHYSSEALAAAVSANMPVWTMQISSVTLVSVAQVFVGQFNGSGQARKVGSAVWQMLWLTGGLALLFLLLTYAGEALLFNSHPVKHLAISYYHWMMLFGFLTPLAATLSCFFVGRGKTTYVMVSTFAGNILNACLNALLIFGVSGWIDPMGVKGAAIATVVGQALQCVMLAAVFLRRKNVEKYGTLDYHLDPSLLKRTLSIGYPTALDRLINVAGWTCFMWFITPLGVVAITVIGITQTMQMFFSFISQGIGRAVSSIAANAIGARQWSQLNRTMFSAISLNCLLCALYGGFFILYPEPFTALFLSQHDALEAREQVIDLVLLSCTWVWLATFVDSIRWVFIGLLTSVGDTRYVMWVGSISVWIFAIIPTGIFVRYFGIPISYSWGFSSLYYFVICCLYAWRFSQEKWKGKLVVSSEEEIEAIPQITATADQEAVPSN